MSEKEMWTNHVRPFMAKAHLDPNRVENLVGEGFPDIEYAYGTVELKHRDEWPLRKGSPVTLPHFTPQQRAWNTRRWIIAKNAWVLLRVGTEWMLFDGLWAAQHVGLTDRDGHIAGARVYSSKGLDQRFYDKLRGVR